MALGSGPAVVLFSPWEWVFISLFVPRKEGRTVVNNRLHHYSSNKRQLGIVLA
jgi:hypothetical protein